MNGVCPICKFNISFYFGSSSKPWCKRCGMYFTMIDHAHVLNNPCTQQDYDKQILGKEPL